MNDETGSQDISKKTVLYRVPGMDAVEVRSDVACLAAASTGVAMDVYAPPGHGDGARAPAVVVVAGYPDAGFERIVGCRFKEMGSSVSWGRLIAASGMVAITYSTNAPRAGLDAVLDELASRSAPLGIDPRRVGLWASSGNGPLAVSALVEHARASIACAALCYAYTLDLDGASAVADAARAFGFANPAAGRSVADLRRDVPIFVARAGRDACPGLNETLDRFAFEALRSNLPVTAVNHPDAPHAFDLDHEGEETRAVIRQILAFLGRHLLV